MLQLLELKWNKINLLCTPMSWQLHALFTVYDVESQDKGHQNREILVQNHSGILQEHHCHSASQEAWFICVGCVTHRHSHVQLKGLQNDKQNFAYLKSTITQRQRKLHHWNQLFLFIHGPIKNMGRCGKVMSNRAFSSNDMQLLIM